MQPINYMQGYHNPLESILNQVKMFQNFSQNANVLAGQREQNRLAMAHNDRRIQAMKELQGIDFKNIDALREFHGRYGDLEYGKGLNDYLANLSEQERKAEIGQLSQVYSALKNERYDTAKNFLLEQAQAYENAGNKDKADKSRQMAQLVESDPTTAFQEVAMGYSLVVPKDAVDNFDKLIKSQAPNIQYHNMGDRMVATMVDPMTGQIRTQNLGEIGVSADTKANNERALDVAHIQGGYNLQERQMQESGANAREQAKLELQSKLAQQEALIKANEVKPMEYGGKMWLVRADGKFKPMLDANGQQLSAGGASDDEKQRIEKLNVSLNEAEKYLNNATGSGVGKLVDDTANFFGFSTKGSIATAQLGTVGGQIVALMPKMSGPQSDKDVEMYKQMAGKLENPTIPIAERKAALQAIRSLNAKYAKMQGFELQDVQPQQTKQSAPADYNNSMRLPE